jgi:hypothetical protein
MSKGFFDLDPNPSAPFETVKLAALGLKRLEGKQLGCLLRCTGGKGLTSSCRSRERTPSATPAVRSADSRPGFVAVYASIRPILLSGSNADKRQLTK